MNAGEALKAICNQRGYIVVGSHSGPERELGHSVCSGVDDQTGQVVIDQPFRLIAQTTLEQCRMVLEMIGRAQQGAYSCEVFPFHYRMVTD